MAKERRVIDATRLAISNATKADPHFGDFTVGLENDSMLDPTLPQGSQSVSYLEHAFSNEGKTITLNANETIKLGFVALDVFDVWLVEEISMFWTLQLSVSSGLLQVKPWIGVSNGIGTDPTDEHQFGPAIPVDPSNPASVPRYSKLNNLGVQGDCTQVWIPRQSQLVIEGFIEVVAQQNSTITNLEFALSRFEIVA